jgi:hypothetical protein
MSDPRDATVTFRGRTVAAAQMSRSSRTECGAAAAAAAGSHPAAPAGSDTPGRIVWECSLSVLKFLGDDDHLALLGALPLTGKRVLELSAGAGLVTLALAACGAEVVAAETAEQLPQLARNLARGEGAPAPVVHYWGAPLGALQAPPAFDFALCCDVLYIALRDGLARELSATLRRLVAGSAARGGLLFAFEERLIDEEAAFMAALAEPLAPAPAGCAPEGAPALRVAELPPPAGAAALTREEALLGCGGEGEQLGALFWLPPPVRLFLLTKL